MESEKEREKRGDGMKDYGEWTKGVHAQGIHDTTTEEQNGRKPISDKTLIVSLSN